MQSRRDQVQAYFFVVGRLVAALTHGKPDILEHPNRRFSTGTVLGFLLAALLVAIFGIYGLFVPGGDSSWRVAGAIVVVKETGARYVYEGNQLRPVLNYSSALLAAGDNSTTVSVSQNSLSGVPVGTPIGIPGAPDDLPAAGKLWTGPWSVCMSGAQTALVLGSSAGDPAGQGLLASTSDGAKYLVWRGSRYRIDGSYIIDALGYAGAEVLPVSAGWLNVLPAGPDLNVPVIAGTGQPGPVVNEKPGIIGQIYEMRNPAINSDQLYVLERDGVAPLTRTMAALFLSAPTTQPAYPNSPVAPIPLGASALAAIPVSATPMPTGYPAQPPTLFDVDSGSVACVRLTPAGNGGMAPAVVLLPRSAVADGVPPAARRTADGMADQVVIPAGVGALVGVANGAAEYLVTDLGVKYPLGDSSVAGTLGYGAATAVKVTSALLGLLPTGPVLAPAAAQNAQLAGP
jgi:type VII secretion protein EccB